MDEDECPPAEKAPYKRLEVEDLDKAVDKACIERFGFSPSVLNELFDVLEHCHTLIHYYQETTSSLSGEMRDEISSLSMRSDVMSLDFDGLYLSASDLKEVAKKGFYFGKKVKADEKLVRKFAADLARARRDLEALVSETRTYVEKVRRFKSY